MDLKRFSSHASHNSVIIVIVLLSAFTLFEDRMILSKTMLSYIYKCTSRTFATGFLLNAYNTIGFGTLYFGDLFFHTQILFHL